MYLRNLIFASLPNELVHVLLLLFFDESWSHIMSLVEQYILKNKLCIIFMLKTNIFDAKFGNELIVTFWLWCSNQVEDLSARQVYEKLLEAVQPWSMWYLICSNVYLLFCALLSECFLWSSKRTKKLFFFFFFLFFVYIRFIYLFN